MQTFSRARVITFRNSAHGRLGNHKVDNLNFWHREMLEKVGFEISVYRGGK